MYDSYPYIEPCCYQKQLPDIFTLADQRGSATYLSNSDWTLSQLLEWLVWRVPSGELTLCLLRIKESTILTLASLLSKTIYSSKLQQHIPLISHLTLITTGQDLPLILSLLSSFPSSRLTLSTYPRLAFRALLIKDTTGLTDQAYIIQGTLNQEPLNALQAVTITSGINPYNELHRPLSSISRLNPSL